ncbi:MAG: TraR/DksA family transcriptional regulator [Deltaproteobacteria bacterium]|nr:TraR/DksA family transcriptional regulator [Deltaproteobacteria bacterium]
MDIIDRAQEYECVLREAAIEEARTRGVDILPIYLGGVRCCVDCEEPIPEERLLIKPDAVRCVACQEKNERK